MVDAGNMRGATALILPLLMLVSCVDRSGQGDEPLPPNANALGGGLRIRDVQDPANGYVNKTVDVTAVSVLAVDSFDETGDGKSRGTIYVQDYGSSDPLSGTSIFSGVLVPASLRLSPNDVVDLHGPYVEVTALGTYHFPKGFLPQLDTPTVKFRYEGETVVPKVIDLDDLQNFDTGRKWINMLVTVNDIYATSAVVTDPSSRRATITIAKTPNGNGFTTEPQLTNELIQLADGSVNKHAKFKSVTGIVTFFTNLHIAPRSTSDMVLDTAAAAAP